MIAHINGRLIEKTPAYVIIECNGVGYQLLISLNTFAKLGSDESCKLFTQFIVREDAQLLYGFADQAERKLFQLLLSVSGVGAATALMVLSAAEPVEIQTAILSNDAAFFKNIKGIGPKSAQRIIIDLKDKVKDASLTEKIYDPADNTIKDEALSALVALGFNRNQASKTIDKILKGQRDMGVEEVIKNALKGL
jgi:Holliday junction DNA helicase RuvA